MRKIISLKEPVSRSVLWAKPSPDGTYLIEQIWGPNGWEVFGEVSGGGSGGTETDPIWNAQKGNYYTKSDANLEKTARDSQINGIITNMNSINSNVNTIDSNVTTIGNILQLTNGVVTQNSEDISELQNKLNNLSIPGSVKWRDDNIPTANDLPGNLTTAEEGYLYQVQDTQKFYLWTGTSYMSISGITDLSEYYNMTQVNDLLDDKLNKNSTNSSVYITDSSGQPNSLQYSANVEANAIPVRNVSGDIAVNNPVSGNYAISETQATGMVVDEVMRATQIENLLQQNKRDILNTSNNVYVTDAVGSQSALPYSVNVLVDSIPVRTPSGNIAVNSSVQGDNAIGYNQVQDMISDIPIVVPDEIFDYSGSNTFTLSQAPKLVSQVWIDSTDSLTLVRVANVSVNGNDVTINNQTFQDGDSIRIHYFI